MIYSGFLLAVQLATGFLIAVCLVCLHGCSSGVYPGGFSGLTVLRGSVIGTAQ